MISIAIEAKSIDELISQVRSIANDLERINRIEEHTEEPVAAKPESDEEQTAPVEQKEEPAPASTIKPEDVRRALNKLRSMLNEKAPGAGTAKIKELFTHLGVTSFSEIDAEDYDRLMDMTAIAIKEAQNAAD